MAGEHEVSLRHGYRDDGGINAVELTRARANRGEIRAVPFIAVSRAALFLVAAIAATALIGWFTAAGPHPLVVLAVAAGALVAGLAGFAFSPVAGALVMHWVAPVTIVPVRTVTPMRSSIFLASSERPAG